MIARLRARLPFDLSIPIGVELPPKRTQFGGYDVTFYAPVQPARALPPSHTYPALTPAQQRALFEASTRPVLNEVIWPDGRRAFDVSLYQIDFRREAFDRSKALDGIDPPEAVVLGALNSLVLRIRSVTSAGHVRAQSRETCVFLLEYLADDTTPLPPDPALSTTAFVYVAETRFAVLTRDIWQQAHDIPADYTPPIWETLLLEAQHVDLELGPSIVLTHSAIETLIAHALDVLAPTEGQARALWEWVHSRGWFKDPSLEEQADQLMKIVSGQSLKERADLWPDFKALGNARNSFIHSGELRVYKEPLTRERADQLRVNAWNVAAWIEERLPPSERRRGKTGSLNLRLFV